ncbi:MAG: phosphoglucosamine mutase [Candidatus Methanomethylophilaceae archaeon]|nr:phosphoglucosamine mutase [Candidatus Methanomethylophilaceae archaeon]
MAQRMFGTNGVRGVVNDDMNTDLALQMGKAIGKFFGGKVAIATDTRVSGDMIKSAVCAGLMSVGCDVRDLGILPTPAIQYHIKTSDKIVGGVMITASHNPPEFNGIKCIDFDGTEMPREKEEKIEILYAGKISTMPWNEIGVLETYEGADEEYIDAVISHVDVDLIKKAKLTAVVDCANGAAYRTTPMMMKKLGVRAITLNADAQGEFPGHPSEPTEDNLADLIALTGSVKADVGIAHDGDADRAVFVARKGKKGYYMPGDKSLAIVAKTIVRDLGGGQVVTPVSSSSMVEEVVKDAGGSLIYTAVGSPVVARRMMKEGAVFGGEENGGLIFADHQYCRDGAMSIAKILEGIAKYGSLYNQVEELPVYHVDKRKIECPNNRKESLIEYMKETFSEGNEVDTTDGLKIIFDDGGWVLLRPSGTEPIFRIYSESKDEGLSKQRAAQFEKVADDFMNGL